jgi:uncharacterized OsmC-like protein
MSVMTVRYLGAVQFEASVRGHKVFCDQPVSSGGFDEGMTPVEFMHVALGTCAGYYVAEYLNKNQLPSEGLEITVDSDKVKGPARLDNFRLGVHVPAKLEAKHLEGMRHAVEKCLIHNTLLNTPSIATSVTAGEPDPIIE